MFIEKIANLKEGFRKKKWDKQEAFYWKRTSLETLISGTNDEKDSMEKKNPQIKRWVQLEMCILWKI